ncbi:MAG TPA: endonuclease/exonuclease/phosphatase family protein [Micromonosporaceae bacterium]|nr:endonuclease/exonuclease/phosphatase family protein [Micromonosporaceae bacterium]
MNEAEIVLRLLCYNVHRLSDDIRAVAQVIRGMAPDVVFVQEVRRFRWRYRCADLARRCGLLVASGGGTALGNLLLVSYRVAVHEAWAMRYPLTPGRHMRGVAFARCSVGSSRFLIAGSHLSTDPAERPGQAALLRAALGAADEPVLLGVDVNDVPSGLAWRTLADGRLDAAGMTGTPTFSVPYPRRRIDAIFVDPRCRVARYEVVDSPEVRRASDHFPVLAEVVLPSLT